MGLSNFLLTLKGGSGSGNHGHSGIPGHRGGSAPSNVSEMKSLLKGKVFNIMPPANKRKVSSEEELQFISELASQHDPKVISKIKKIILVEDKYFTEMVNGISGEGGKETTGFWLGDSKYLYLRHNSNQQETASTFHHEVGHVAIDASKTKKAWINKYEENKGFDRHSEYSFFNADEGFADSYMAYTQSKGISKYPDVSKTFSVVEEVLRGIK